MTVCEEGMLLPCSEIGTRRYTLYGSDISSWDLSVTSRNSGLLLRAQRRRVFQEAGSERPASVSFPLNSAQACKACIPIYNSKSTKLGKFVNSGCMRSGHNVISHWESTITSLSCFFINILCKYSQSQQTCECNYANLKNGSILFAAEILLSCMLPWDAKHSLSWVIPDQTCILSTADLLSSETSV